MVLLGFWDLEQCVQSLLGAQRLRVFDRSADVSAQLLVNEWPLRDTHMFTNSEVSAHTSGLENVGILLVHRSLNGSRAPPIQAVLQVHSLTYMNYTRVTTSVAQTSRP